MLAISTIDNSEFIQTKMLSFYKIQEWKYYQIQQSLKTKPQFY